MKLSLFSFLVLALVVVASPTSRPLFDVKWIPYVQGPIFQCSILTPPKSPIATGPINADFVSTANSLDGPKLSAINSTSWDGWYFEAVSPDLKSSIVIVFYTATAVGFPFVDFSEDVTVLSVHTSFPNGTLVDRYIYANEVVVTTVKEGTSGIYEATGGAWFGAPDLSQYVVTINCRDLHTEIESACTLSMRPCRQGTEHEVGPHIGWSNAIPDAVGIVDFKIDGSHLAFTGESICWSFSLAGLSCYRYPEVLSTCRIAKDRGNQYLRSPYFPKRECETIDIEMFSWL